MSVFSKMAAFHHFSFLRSIRKTFFRSSDLGVTFLTECRTIFGLHSSLPLFWPFGLFLSTYLSLSSSWYRVYRRCSLDLTMALSINFPLTCSVRLEWVSMSLVSHVALCAQSFEGSRSLTSVREALYKVSPQNCWVWGLALALVLKIFN